MRQFECSECGGYQVANSTPSTCPWCGIAGTFTEEEIDLGPPRGAFRHLPRTKIKVYPAEPKRREDSVDLAGQLQQLTELWRSGALSDAEFEKAKSRLIDGGKS